MLLLFRPEELPLPNIEHNANGNPNDQHQIAFLPIEEAFLPDETVIAVEGDWPLPETALFSGKHVLNCTQPYANPEKWKAIDPDEKWSNVYNRLCHISLSIGEETSFEVQSTDLIHATLTIDDLHTLGTQVLLTQKRYMDLSLIKETESWRLYWIEKPLSRKDQ